MTRILGGVGTILGKGRTPRDRNHYHGSLLRGPAGSPAACRVRMAILGPDRIHCYQAMAQEHLQVVKGGKRPDLQGRILARFLEKVEADQRIPRDVVRRLKTLVERGEMTSAEEIIKAIRPAENAQ